MNETNTGRARTRGGEGVVKGHSGSDWGSGALPMVHFTVNVLNLGLGRALGGPLMGPFGALGDFEDDGFLLNTDKSQHHSAVGA